MYYRATAIGRGVTPDPFWQSAPRGRTTGIDLQANDSERLLFAGDRCVSRTGPPPHG